MLGYTERDTYKMMAAINIAKSYVPANSSNDEVRNGLEMVFDLLDGLLAEGRI